MKRMFGFFASAFSKLTHGSMEKSKRAIFNSDKLRIIVFQSHFLRVLRWGLFDAAGNCGEIIAQAWRGIAEAGVTEFIAFESSWMNIKFVRKAIKLSIDSTKLIHLLDLTQPALQVDQSSSGHQLELGKKYHQGSMACHPSWFYLAWVFNKLNYSKVEACNTFEVALIIKFHNQMP